MMMRRPSSTAANRFEQSCQPVLLTHGANVRSSEISQRSGTKLLTCHVVVFIRAAYVAATLVGARHRKSTPGYRGHRQ